MNIRGPISRPSWIERLRFSSLYGEKAPVVRMVVTPLARYRRGALKLSCTRRPRVM